MKRSLAVFGLTVALSSGALAQADKDHQQHHPSGAPQQAQPGPAPSPAPGSPATPAPAQGQMMQNMPEQCRSMMQNMQTCMGTMHQMMHGRTGGGMGSGMMGGGTTGGGMMGGGMGQQGSQPMPGMQAAPTSPATKAFLDAAQRMHAPMMEGVLASDPDIAFVRGMIPHHQAAIDMAKVVLQYGKDPLTRKLAEDVVREQQREITEMQEWLTKNAR
jgi:hypothetical protein